MDAHLEVIHEELCRWELSPSPTLRIASFDKSVPGNVYQSMSSVVSVSCIPVFKKELITLKHSMVSARMIVSLVPDVHLNEKIFMTYLSSVLTVMYQMTEEMSRQVHALGSLAEVFKKYVKIPDTSESYIKAKDIIKTISYNISLCTHINN